MHKNKSISAKLSVCIVSNVVNETLSQAVSAFDFPEFEICVGFNNISPSNVAPFQKQHPTVNCYFLDWKGYGPTKNALTSKASTDWILSIDDDEVADAILVSQLRHLDLSQANVLYRFKLRHQVGEHKIKHGTYGSIEWKTRVYNKSKVNWNEAKVHEALIVDTTCIYKNLDGILWHYTANSMEEVRQKNNQYAQLSAQNMFQKGKKANALKPLMAGTMAFLKQYFFKIGLLDGAIGLQLALESARYTFMKYDFLRKMH